MKKLVKYLPLVALLSATAAHAAVSTGDTNVDTAIGVMDAVKTWLLPFALTVTAVFVARKYLRKA